ncbi:sodium:alanine symporter family protein [Rickettsiales endosymbiont of Peranema trichophorum]|uniref:amino acid carrier protein n=1 Tax=Rickettsiales endosymbiont of Peranema trichophorum TaxID=2486577 RepID=UPI00102300B8|nr:amino acid carrier protein [Rickettsiales endosymbiont of Peranema trichophorum]RZI46327.1 sodium:alanine symporter family protein [Rickettsiales endosymbiont of Peranema trichophorum]
MNALFDVLTVLDDIYWSYVGFSIVILAGIFFTIKCKGFQFKVLMAPVRTMKELYESAQGQEHGTNPFKLYFASIGGMIGLGNMVAVVAAQLIGGPGALLWMWIAVFFGMIIKYSEIYLGVRYRVKNESGGFDGGPMYYLKAAFPKGYLGKLLPVLAAVFLCIYGVEIYQFVVIVDTITEVFEVERLVVVIVLLSATIYTGFGGVNRLANICSVLMPVFMVMYIFMCMWVIIENAWQLPGIIFLVFKSAFTGMAPLGAFVGSTMLLAAQQGISRAVYSGDIGIGYDSTIQSETRSNRPERQARIAVFGLLGDALFSTMTILSVLVTGLVWNAEGLKASQYIATALATVFPYVKFFMVLFFFFAGWTTIIGYVVVGTKCARFLAPKYGKTIYLVFATIMFLTFSYADQSHVYLIMSLSGGALVVLNVIGLLKLRNQIKFGWH